MFKFQNTINKINILTFLLVILVFLFDRLSKVKIINYVLKDGNNNIYINDYLNLDLVWNRGIGFGLLDMESGILYHLLSFLILLIIFVLIYIITKSNNIDKFLYSMILGGALGNFYDRVIYYSVPDFIDIHYNNFHWFTFNIADIFISLGIILILLREITPKNMKKINFIVLILSLILFLTSCGGLKEAGDVLRNEKTKSTDEFLIKKRKPLTEPPDFKNIPEPGSLSEEKEKNDIERIFKITEKSSKKKSPPSSAEDSILNQIKK